MWNHWNIPSNRFKGTHQYGMSHNNLLQRLLTREKNKINKEKNQYFCFKINKVLYNELLNSTVHALKQGFVYDISIHAQCLYPIKIVLFNFFCLQFRKHLSLFTFKQGKGSKKVNWAIAFCWSKFTKSRQLVFLMIWNMPFKSSNCQVLYSNFEIILLFDHQDLIHMSPNSCYYFFYFHQVSC